MISLSDREGWFGQPESRSYGLHGPDLVELFETRLAGIGRSKIPRAHDPIVVPRGAWLELLQATKRLLRLQRDLVMALGASPLERVEALGARSSDFPRFTRLDSFEREFSLAMSRSDVVVSPTGPRFIEFNVGAGVGGALEFEIERDIWREMRLNSGHRPFIDASVYGLLSKALRRAGSVPNGRLLRVFLVSSLADPAKTPEYFEAQRHAFNRHGIEAVALDVGDVGSLSAADCLNSVALMQFNEREMRDSGVALDGIATGIELGLVAIPSQTARLIDSKSSMALLSTTVDELGSTDRDLVETYVPWTRVLRDSAVIYEGQRVNLLDFIVERRASMVIKSSDGYSSKEVHFGHTLSASQWSEIIQTAVTSGYYVVQEVVEARRIPIEIVDVNGSVETVLCNPRICPFHIDGEGTGYYMRFDTSELPGPVGRASGAMPGCVMALT